MSKSLYQFNNLNEGNNFDGSFDAPHNFIWSHAYHYKKLEMSLGWRFRSGIPYTIKRAELRSNTLRVVFDDLNTGRLPNYQRLDFSARYKFYLNTNKKIKAQLGITFQNLLNERNILSRNYEIETIVSQQQGSKGNRNEREVLVETDNISLGFVPNLMFRCSF